MASLNKLAIRGIRSFDDKQISVIEFFSPVTVIVGHNGSGKTTIIECLKYATTGDQPPNTRGGAFVHDPKMANEKEVKAQVKLRFDAANGQRMLAVRNLSVTVKKNGAMTMKTLESILALADKTGGREGKRGVISTKCAEMDTEIPHLLGVSKAVLENVIFCHQEDSYWPLSEPSTLKKKFDDIFEATKYSKALDSIKALRKDRVAELKVEKERLDGLSREKARADKLNNRKSDLNCTIAAKEIEYEELKKQYELLVKANQKFYDSATKFREIYLKVEDLTKQRARYQEELDETRETLQELDGSDEELADRMKNFDAHIARQKQKQLSENSKLQAIEDDLKSARETHVKLSIDQGEYLAEEKSQEQRIKDCEGLIREISAKHQIKGYDVSPLGRDKTLDFISLLGDLLQRQHKETDRLQEEANGHTDEYNRNSRQLQMNLDRLKQERATLHDRVTSLQEKIHNTEIEVEAAQALTAELRTLKADMEEIEHRIKKSREEIEKAKYDEHLAEKNTKAKNLELKREVLNAELSKTSAQAEARARLDLKKTELKGKSAEVKNILNVNSARFRKLVGSEAQPETMEQELDRVFSRKERECVDLEKQSAAANQSLQVAQTELTNLRRELKVKEEDLKECEKRVQDGLVDYTENNVEDAIRTANEEISTRTTDIGKNDGAHGIFKHFLQVGQVKRNCPLCSRDMDVSELATFEKTVKDLIRKSSPEATARFQSELTEWEQCLRDLQSLTTYSVSSSKLRSEVPMLIAKVEEKEEELPILIGKAEELQERLNFMKRELKDMSNLRQQATVVSRTQRDVERLEREIKDLERTLSDAGSLKSVQDIERELDSVVGELRANDRERQNLMTERDRQMSAVRTHENELHGMQLRHSELNSRLRDRSALERRIEDMRQDITSANARIKELDGKIIEAQAPIDQLEEQYHLSHRELTSRLAEAQQASQALNADSDRLQMNHKQVERYIRDKRHLRLKECEARINEYEERIQDLSLRAEAARQVISLIEKEINESGASMANLRANIRVRRLLRDIAATEAEINSFDMEEAARAKRIFQEKYQFEKQKETELQSKYAHVGGELSSFKSQVQQLDNDLQEFKSINKKYRDQLVKVKMSDMANNDLEKYAKALDSAIMKYHALKMEEVNDTMRHLWNKTYQGTDIDGIKISSDSEGGPSKRTYNYRVVMTKDQVEMDMRGRCSAGQKMLASIIIRLALADSFGQNCGILALDEPTNALDTENIDALAASLVDIINERKNHANFQLIIITHDENFLRKLGQSDVMEYYWRVSRDSRQKSVIERNRFG